MARLACPGIVGNSPLGFLAGVGIARALSESVGREQFAVCWSTQSWCLEIAGCDALETVVSSLEKDRASFDGSPVLTFSYPKLEKQGVKPFRGLKAPVGVWKHWILQAIAAEDRRALGYAAVLASETAVEPAPATKRVHTDDLIRIGIPPELAEDASSSTLPTFFDFTSRNTQFLDQVDVLRSRIDEAAFLDALMGRGTRSENDRTLGWDTASDRPAALYSYGPPTNHVLEWLAFRGLTFFPLSGSGAQLRVTSCRGRRKGGTFAWPLWTFPCSVPVVTALLRSDWARVPLVERRLRGIAQVFESDLAKAADGYTGIFSPSRPA